MSKSMDIKYHYAHIATQGTKVSMVDLVDKEKGIIKINDSIINGGAILVRLSSKAINSVFVEEIMGAQLAVDLYSGIVGLDTTRYHYSDKAGYTINSSCGYLTPKDTEDFGYVMELPPRLAILFTKKLAFVESFQGGKVKIYISSLDLHGYIDFLFGEGILTIVRMLEPSPLPPFEEMVMKEIKEVREQKDEKPVQAIELSPVQEMQQLTLTESQESAVSLLGGDVESAVNLHLES